MQVLRCGEQPVDAFAQTANISSNGILFYSDLAPAVGDPMEYVVTLTKGGGRRKSVQLHCMGKVVRHDAETKVAAATLERYEFMRI